MINNAFCKFNRNFGNNKRIFPIKNNLEYYKKFIKESEEENIIYGMLFKIFKFY